MLEIKQSRPILIDFDFWMEPALTVTSKLIISADMMFTERNCDRLYTIMLCDRHTVKWLTMKK